MTRQGGPTSVGAVVRFLDGVALRSADDRELLDRFAATRDEAAFRVLAERHGPMVLGVCRRVLGRLADAEDAFQATFLVLARQAGSIRKADGLAGWLHGVARRVAIKLRRAQRRRVRHERAVRPSPGRPPLDELTRAEVKAGLDDELARLPAEYREVLILCYLEGLTRNEAARRLGVAVGVVKGRLERGRKLLADRLARRGLDLSACLLPAVLPPEVVAVAVRSAARLVGGGAVGPFINEILTGMAMSKLKWLGVAACALLLVVGIGVGLAMQPGGPAVGPPGADEVFVRRSEAPPGTGKAPPLTLAEPVRAARWSGDGRVMATLSSRVDTVDGKEVTLSRFRVWDAATAKLKADLGELEYRGLNSYALSADGKVFALSIRGRIDVGDKVELWDAEKGALLRTIEMDYGRSRVWFSFAPDGGSLAVCGSDVKGDRLIGTVRLFDTTTGKPTKKLVSDGDITISVAHAPDGKTVAAGGYLGEITVWDVATEKVTRSLKAGGAVAAVAFSPDGKRLVAGGREAPAAVWDLATGKDRPLKGDAFAAEHLAFSADGRYIAGLAAQAKRDEKENVWKNAVRVWLAESGEVLHEWHTTGYGVAFSPDGKELRFLDDAKTVKRVVIAGE